MAWGTPDRQRRPTAARPGCRIRGDLRDGGHAEQELGSDPLGRCFVALHGNVPCRKILGNRMPDPETRQEKRCAETLATGDGARASFADSGLMKGLTFRFHKNPTVWLGWIALLREDSRINESLELFFAGHFIEALLKPFPCFLNR